VPAGRLRHDQLSEAAEALSANEKLEPADGDLTGSTLEVRKATLKSLPSAVSTSDVPPWQKRGTNPALRPGARHPPQDRRETLMLWTVFVVLLVLWLLGMVSSYTLGGFIHILLVVAVAVVLIRVIQGRRPV
jgi:hypothetical protein